MTPTYSISLVCVGHTSGNVFTAHHNQEPAAPCGRGVQLQQEVADKGQWPGNTPWGTQGQQHRALLLGWLPVPQGTPVLIPAGPSGALPGLLTSLKLFTLLHYIDKKELSVASRCQKQSSGVTTCRRLQHVSESPEVLLSKKKNIYIYSLPVSQLAMYCTVTCWGRNHTFGGSPGFNTWNKWKSKDKGINEYFLWLSHTQSCSSPALTTRVRVQS